MKKLSLFTDGGARGNPGPAGIGVVILEDEKVIVQYGKYLGEATNNQAEYQALISGLETLKEMGTEEVDIFMDSELIVKQVKGEYKVKDQILASLYLKVYNLLTHFKYSITHVRREGNKLADAMVNEALDKEAL